MVDYFAIAVTHFLLVIAAIRLLNRADLDRADVAPGTALHGAHRKLRVPAGQPHPVGSPVSGPLHPQKRR
jgi:hypothetical protein